MLNLLITIFAHFTPTHAATCDFAVALSKPGYRNICLMEAGKWIKNPDDKKTYYKMIEAWHPPKGFQFVIANGFSRIAIDGQLQVEAAWISMQPAILYWNGKILKASEAHNSFFETYKDLMNQLEPKHAASFNLLWSTAYAQNHPVMSAQAIADANAIATVSGKLTSVEFAGSNVVCKDKVPQYTFNLKLPEEVAGAKSKQTLQVISQPYDDKSSIVKIGDQFVRARFREYSADGSKIPLLLSAPLLYRCRSPKDCDTQNMEDADIAKLLPGDLIQQRTTQQLAQSQKAYKTIKDMLTAEIKKQRLKYGINQLCSDADRICHVPGDMADSHQKLALASAAAYDAKHNVQPEKEMLADMGMQVRVMVDSTSFTKVAYACQASPTDCGNVLANKAVGRVPRCDATAITDSHPTGSSS